MTKRRRPEVPYCDYDELVQLVDQLEQKDSDPAPEFSPEVVETEVVVDPIAEAVYADSSVVQDETSPEVEVVGEPPIEIASGPPEWVPDIADDPEAALAAMHPPMAEISGRTRMPTNVPGECGFADWPQGLPSRS